MVFAAAVDEKATNGSVDTNGLDVVVEKFILLDRVGSRALIDACPKELKLPEMLREEISTIESFAFNLHTKAFDRKTSLYYT